MNEFLAGAVLSRSIAVWIKNIIPFSILALVCHVPSFLFTYLALKGGLHMSLFAYTALSAVLSGLLSMIAQSTIVYGVFQELRGRPAPLGESISVGLGRIFGVLGTTIVVGLAVGVGFLMLVVPGIIISTMLFVAVPAAVVEKVGGFEACSRSSSLTSGYRWKILGIAVVVALASMAAGFIIQKIMAPSPGEMYSATSALVMVAFSALLTPFSATTAAVAYHDLRRTKEGVDIHQIASVFD